MDGTVRREAAALISKSVEKRVKVMHKGPPPWQLPVTTGTNVMYANAPSNSTSFTAASLMGVAK